MAVTSGKIGGMKVSQVSDLASIWIEEDDSSRSFFLIWYPTWAPYDYVYHSIWVSMLRDALVHSLRVDIAHEEDSVYVQEVGIRQAAP